MPTQAFVTHSSAEFLLAVPATKQEQYSRGKAGFANTEGYSCTCKCSCTLTKGKGDRYATPEKHDGGQEDGRPNPRENHV